MKILIDAYAWIAYLEGGIIGEKVNSFFSKNYDVYVVPITIAEVVSKVKRNGGDADLVYNVLVSRARVVQISSEIARKAGLFHAQIRKDIKGFGMADALLLLTAQEIGAKVLTGDNHFKGFKNVILI